MHEKKILYLHIGMPKTGTSALQEFFKLNSDQLKEQGVIYPETGQYDDYSHHNIPFSLARNIYKRKLSKAQQVSFLNELNEETDSYPRVLLSSECFSMLGKHRLFLKYLSQYETRIICYLRRQDLFIESHYRQVVADPAFMGTNYKIDKHIKQLHNTMTYLPFIRSWAKLGPIIIRPYERESFVDGNIFSDFCDAIDVRINTSFVFPDEIVNPTDSNAFVDFMRILKSHKLLGGVLNIISSNELKTLVNQVISNEDTSSLLSQQERLDLLHKFSSSNKEIAQLYLDKDELFGDQYIHDNESMVYGGLSERELFLLLSEIVDEASLEEAIREKWNYFDGMSENEIVDVFSEILAIDGSDNSAPKGIFSVARKFINSFSRAKTD